MKNRNIHRILIGLIATIWLLNGLVCKVLNLVPRHEQIVENILNQEFSRVITVVIGLSEILMAIWILSRFKSKYNAIVQIIVVSIMNIIEFLLVPELLLWGRFNAGFALVFIALVYYNEFVLNRNLSLQPA